MPPKKKGSQTRKKTIKPKKTKKQLRPTRTAATQVKKSSRKRAIPKHKRKVPTRPRPERGVALLQSAETSQGQLTELALRVFTGTVRISGNQSILNGRILVRAGVGDFSSAMGAATQFLLNQGINDGDTISVSGTETTMQNGGQSINVIVMVSAQPSAS